jgi:hypothetical protein
MYKEGNNLDLNTNKKEVIVFRYDLAPGLEVNLQERVKAKGTIESVRVRFYKGQQLALKVNPYVEHTLQRNENLVTYSENSKQELSGDDDSSEYPSVVTVDVDDYIKVWAKNTDGVNTYTIVVDVVLDYYGGADRVV